MMTMESSRPPLRIALLGLGRSMFTEHYPIFTRHPALFQVVAACDVSKARRDIVEKDYPDCRMFRQYADMLDERDIDLVVIATSTKDHAKHALMSMKKGFWTLVETPMALSLEEAQLLRGQAMKSMRRLIVLQRGYFSAEFQLAKMAMADSRLGSVYDLRICREDYVRRDDWQCVSRMGGGAVSYAMTDLLVQVLKLLPAPPVQMWSDLKRIASLGDAEDYARVSFKTREGITADVEFNGGCLSRTHSPAFVVRGDRGVFRVEAGATEGLLTVVDPKFSFPRRRSSVRMPPLQDLHEDLHIVDIPLTLPPGTLHGPSAFWRHVYDSVRTAAPFPLQLEDSIDAIKFAQLMKKTSPFGK